MYKFWLLVALLCIQHLQKTHGSCASKNIPYNNNYFRSVYSRYLYIQCTNIEFINFDLDDIPDKLSYRVQYIQFINSSIPTINNKLGTVNVKDLRINYANAQTIAENAFHNTTITILNFDDNIIDVIESKAFDSPSILSLSMKNNSLRELKQDTFHGLPQLNTLYLQNNLINFISAETFNVLPVLEELDISNNRLRQLSDGTFSSLLSLQSIWLNNNQLIKIQENMFVNNTRLNYTYLQNNKLSHFDACQFPESVAFVNVSRNELVDCNFSNRSKITKIDVSYNAINNKSYFNNLDNVESLIVSHNNIGNSIQSLKLPKLMDLKLVSCGISSVNSRNIYRSPHLQTLAMMDNNLQEVDFYNFSDSLNFLNLSSNMLRKLHNVSTLNNLISLDLSDNLLESIEFDMFKGLNVLMLLDLAHNRIATLAMGTFGSVPMLNTLNLSYNHLSKLTNGIFHGLTELQTLDLSHNRIAKLEEYLFHNLHSLNTLDISYNDLKTANIKDVLDHLSNLLSIGLQGNNWKCKDLQTVANSGKRVKIIHGNDLQVENLYGIGCVSDGEELSFEHKLLKSIEDLNDNSNSIVRSLTVVICFLIVIILILLGKIVGRRVVELSKNKHQFTYKYNSSMQDVQMN